MKQGENPLSGRICEHHAEALLSHQAETFSRLCEGAASEEHKRYANK